MPLPPEERIQEDEIILDPLDKAVALDEYLDGRSPLSWSTGGLNQVGSVTVTGKKKKPKKDTHFIIYIVLAVVILAALLTVIYYRTKKR